MDYTETKLQISPISVKIYIYVDDDHEVGKSTSLLVTFCHRTSTIIEGFQAISSTQFQHQVENVKVC